MTTPRTVTAQPGSLTERMMALLESTPGYVAEEVEVPAYYSAGQTIPGHGTVDRMTDTGYLLVGGGFVAYVTVHPRPAVAGLVTFADGSQFAGASRASDGSKIGNRSRKACGTCGRRYPHRCATPASAGEQTQEVSR